MKTEILNLIVETLQAQEKTIEEQSKKILDLEKKSKDRDVSISSWLIDIEDDNELEGRIERIEESLLNLHTRAEDLEVRIVYTEDSIFNIENIDIEDELRNSCAFTELEEKVLELEEPQGFISEIGNKSFIESNREELDGLKDKVSGLETILRSVGEALNK